MANSYYTFYFNMTSLGMSLSTEQLQTVGEKAWGLLEKKLTHWEGRVVSVQDHDLTFEVEALELCEDDVGVNDVGRGTPGLSYGIGFYTEQQGLALTQEHLAHAQALCIQAFSEAAIQEGFAAAEVKLCQVDFHQRFESVCAQSAPSLELLQTRKDEKYWVASDGDQPIGLYFDRDKAFASEAPYIDSFNAAGARLEGYKLVGPETDADYKYSEADYTTDF